MQQPQFDLLSQLQQQPMCRWPICTGLLALLVGLTVINCGASAPARVFGRHLAFAEVQRDARRADEPAGVTHWKPSTVDLGKRCDPRRWSFVEFPAPGADVAVDARTMGRFLVCFDNNDLGAALAGSVARGGTVDDEDVVSVNNLVSNFITHPDAANVFSVFDDVSSDDVQALASGSPPAPSLRQLLLRCLKTTPPMGLLPQLESACAMPHQRPTRPPVNNSSGARISGVASWDTSQLHRRRRTSCRQRLGTRTRSFRPQRR
jgi:hypothetical protein